MTTSVTAPQIRPLTGLRAVLAAWVVLGHLWLVVLPQASSLDVLARPALATGVAIDGFLLLSGFVLAHAHAAAVADGRWDGAVGFWRRRVARILPLRLVVVAVLLLVGAALSGRPASGFAEPLLGAGDAVRSVLFLHHQPGLADAVAAWAVPAEAVAYLLFPLLVVVVGRLRSVVVVLGLAVVVAVGAAVALGVLDGVGGDPGYGSTWLRVAATFPVGVLLHRAWVLLGATSGRRWDGVALVGAVGVVGAVLAVEPTGAAVVPVVALPFLGLVVVGVAGSGGPVASALSSRVLQVGGRWAYAAVVTHLAVLHVYEQVARQYALAATSAVQRVAVLLVFVVVLVAVAGAAWQVVEEPARRVLGARRVGRVEIDREPLPPGADIPALTGLRAVAATWVVLLHYSATLLVFFALTSAPYRLVTAGNLGVDLFFVLSGFVITHNYVGRLARPSARETARFWALRFGRIYPVHLAMIAVVAVFAIVSRLLDRPVFADELFDPVNVVANLLMLNEYPDRLSINGPAWSVSLEFTAYVVFPLLALGLARLRDPRTAFALAGLTFVVGLLAVALTFRSDYQYVVYGLAWMRIVIGFVAGCLLNMGWRLLRRGGTGRHWDVAVVVAVVGAAVSIVMTSTEYPIHLPIVAIPFLGLLVLACAGATGFAARVLGHPWMLWGGRISYSLYMTHFVVVIAFNYAVVPSVLGSSNLVQGLSVLGAVVVTYLVAWGCYALVEEPARTWFRRALR